MRRLAPWLGPVLLLGVLAGLPVPTAAPAAGSPALAVRPGEVLAGAGGAPARPFVPENRSCKPSAPIELSLAALEPEADGRVTLLVGGLARERLGAVDWHLELPPGVRVLSGPTHGRLRTGEELAARVEVAWPGRAEVTTAALVAAAPLGDAPGERVIARRALHRLPEPVEVPVASAPATRAAADGEAPVRASRAAVPVLWREGR